MRILLIDEDTDFHQYLLNIIGRSDVIIDHSIYISCAKDKLRAHHYDLVMLDPHINGAIELDIISRIKSLTPTPILVVTHCPSISLAIVAIKLGAENYFAKTNDLELYLTPYMNKHFTVTNETPKLHGAIEKIRWNHMQKVLKDMHGNISAAAKVLGINRRTLHRQINRHTTGESQHLR